MVQAHNSVKWLLVRTCSWHLCHGKAITTKTRSFSLSASFKMMFSHQFILKSMKLMRVTPSLVPKKLLAISRTFQKKFLLTLMSAESSASAPMLYLAISWLEKLLLRAKQNSHLKSVCSVQFSVRRLAKFAIPHSKFHTVKVEKLSA